MATTVKKLNQAEIINILNEKQFSYIAKVEGTAIEFQFGLLQQVNDKVEKHRLSIKQDGTVSVAGVDKEMNEVEFKEWLDRVIAYKKKQEEIAELFKEII
ncbi:MULTISPECIES: hypothetical protein [unclassified Psychrobacillus]|uniref:hypothetical protein n=1 Tax=unclassified Psychrobacillus TaxID=2636677 RepID=UPI0030FCA675